MTERAGTLTRISGAVVQAALEQPMSLGEVARAGAAGLFGEVIALDENAATVQVYEDTSGLTPGEPLFAEGAPLSVELGPGLLDSVFDGVQRPLPRLAEIEGDFLARGQRLPALPRDKRWPFVPAVQVGDVITPGMILGRVQETSALEHRVLAPPHVSGKAVWVAEAGDKRVEEIVVRVATADGELALPMFHRWRVRAPRPVRERLPAATPMITGQRVLDTLFPIPLGGAAGMPGGFGTGKTILQQSLCRFADADVIVYVGCGERGNEMTHLLRELPDLPDPRTGRPLAERTVLIANTSNMPVPARESSIYTGVTIAEYYRDMGYRVALLADSTSRWAEALREISGRLEEIPAEEGYPPYLASRLAAFYERAGRVTALSGAEGSVTIISAISPPGGDLTEPVTRHTQEFTRTFWTLDKELASARSFPAISVKSSYGDLPPGLVKYWERELPGWTALRAQALTLLEEADRLQATARLVGEENLPDRQRFTLAAAALLREGFLQQNAYDPREARCSPQRQAQLLALVLQFREAGLAALDRGVPSAKLSSHPLVASLRRARAFGEEELPKLAALGTELRETFRALEA